MKAYEIFQKLVKPTTEQSCNQYLYSDGTKLYHGFTCGGIHVWDIITPEEKVDPGFVERGAVPVDGTCDNPKMPWVSAGTSNYPVDEIKLAALNAGSLRKHWSCIGNFEIPWKRFNLCRFVIRLYSDSSCGLFRFNGEDWVYGDPSKLKFPLKDVNIMAIENIGRHLTDDFEAYDVSIYPTMHTTLWSNGTTSVISADYTLGSMNMGDGDLFNVVKEEKGYTIKIKRGKKEMITVKVPLNNIAPEDKEKKVAEVADKIVQPTTEAPNWEIPKNVKKEEEKVSEKVKDAEEAAVEKVAENVEKALENATENGESGEEQMLSLPDAIDALATAAEIFEESLKVGLTNYKILTKELHKFAKRLHREMKNSTDSKELKAAQAEIKNLQKANSALRQALLNGLSGESKAK